MAEGKPFDPLAELSLTPQAAKSIKTLHLGDKRISAIHPNFQYFGNLESLWLSKNQIRKVENLFPVDYLDNSSDISDRSHGKGCVRLRALYLSNNNIVSLAGDLRHMHFLEVLLLANNRLVNMEVVASFLKHLHFLKQLDLFGNPLTEEYNYREFMIYSLQSVQVFDRKTVESSERQRALELFSPNPIAANKCAFGKAFDKSSAPKVAKALPISPCVAHLQSSIQSIRSKGQRKAVADERREKELAEQLADELRRLKAPAAETQEVIHSVYSKAVEVAAAQGRDAYRGALLRILIRDNEMQALQDAFAVNTRLRAEDCVSVCQTLQVTVDDTLNRDVSVWAATPGDFNFSHLVERLIDHPAFLRERLEYLYGLARGAVGQGNAALAKQLHREINTVNDHLAQSSR